MKNYCCTILLFVFSGLFAQAKTVVASTVSWKAYKTLKADAFSHFGTVQMKAGNFTTDAHGDAIGGNFIIDMKTISADDEQGRLKEMLERHLKSDDFFDIAQYPTVFFKINSIKKTNDKKYNSLVYGSLTIKGIAKNINFPAEITTENGTLTFQSAQFTFNRHDFGLKYDTFEDMAIANDVEIKVKATAK